MLQPSALNKLSREMIFNNQKGKVLQKLLLLHIFFKRIFCTKKLWYFRVRHIWPFFASYFSSIFLNGEFISSSNLFASTIWSASTCFFKVVMPFFIKYVIVPFLSFVLRLYETKFTWQFIHLMIWGLLPSTMLLLFTMKNDQHNAFLSCPLHFSLCKCNSYKFVLIFCSSLWMTLNYVCILLFSSIVSIRDTSSIETWLRKTSQYSFSIIVSLVFEHSILQEFDVIIMEKKKRRDFVHYKTV